ncbi:MAG: NAD(P)/FAD-dependent oxidoreductase [Acidobacteriota bacterium]
MKVRVKNVRLELDQDESLLPQLAAKKLGLSVESVESTQIVRKAVDARRAEVHLVYSLDVEVSAKIRIPKEALNSPEIVIMQSRPESRLIHGDVELDQAPVIIGAGPAGLFCAMLLAQEGYKPVILERGRDVDSRVKDVDEFWQTGILSAESNPQFGEGGAGTFSDGKLTTRIGDERVNYVLDTFVRFGAPPEISYLKKPHVGTDRLREIIKCMRREILSMGGRIYFDARVTDIMLEGGRVTGLEINDSLKIKCGQVVLAIGNSARDVYRLLHERSVSIIPKGFAVGVRIEHSQSLIDKIQYGKHAGHPKLEPADYHLTYQDPETGRALYTFCMCPGGQVIACSSAPGQVVTNGMSLYARDSGMANSALVVTVPTHSLDDENPLAGMELQEMLENKAFEVGGSTYSAPAQRVVDFLAHQPSKEASGTYRPGVTPSNLWNVLPHDICSVLARGLRQFDRTMPGFAAPEVVLTGVETRTSSPLRIERSASYCSVSCEGLYPCGEGAGYAGGIVSAAVDGLKVAEAIIKTYAKPLRRPEIVGGGLTDARNLE